MAGADAARATGRGEPIGVLVPAGAGRGERLAATVIAAELARRLPGRDVAPLDADRARSGSGPVVVHDRIAPDAAGPPPAVRVPLADPSGEARPPVATLLTDRLFDPEVVAARAAQLRLLGTLPPAGPVLLAVLDGGAAPAELTAGVAELAFAERLGPVVADAAGGLRRVGGDAPEEADHDQNRDPDDDLLDLAAACSVAGLVVADDPALAGLGLAYGRPTVGLSTGPAPTGAWPAGAVVVDALDRVAAALGPARVRAADGAERLPARDRLDAALDAVAATLRELAPETEPAAPPSPDELAGRLALVEAAYAGLQRRVRAERLAFGAVASDLLAPKGDPDRQRLWVRVLTAEDEVKVAEARADEAHADATRTGSALAVLGATVTRQEAELRDLRARAAEADRLAAEVEQLRPASAELAELQGSQAYRLARIAVRLAGVARRRRPG